MRVFKKKKGRVNICFPVTGLAYISLKCNFTLQSYKGNLQHVIKEEE